MVEKLVSRCLRNVHAVAEDSLHGPQQGLGWEGDHTALIVREACRIAEDRRAHPEDVQRARQCPPFNTEPLVLQLP